MKKLVSLLATGTLSAILMIGCGKDDDEKKKGNGKKHEPTFIQIESPQGFGRMVAIPPDNPTTAEGVELGRHLFYEKKLSRDNTISCGCCHKQEGAFSDPGVQFSVGVDGKTGDMNSMAIINMMWQDFFFWDGRSHSLEHQAFFPVIDENEMDETWERVEDKLSATSLYPPMFKDAFGDDEITQERITKAIAQFERTLISGNSKYDKAKLRNPKQATFTDLEENGFFLFEESERGDCFHCHGADFSGHTFAAYGAFQFSNNGLDLYADMNPGRYAVTGDPMDYGKFKVPTLRNVAVTFPYMHDGRFNTLREVIEHYNEGGKPSATIDPNMKHVGVGLNLTQYEKESLEAFLETLTDPDFITNPDFSDPFINDPDYVPCP
ncbi:MAG: cytochrome-c peroxidase [Cryomorphaceae bacterium]|nr:cytochrome-c peroxidase [Cryomorphaceae bacterium]